MQLASSCLLPSPIRLSSVSTVIMWMADSQSGLIRVRHVIYFDSWYYLFSILNASCTGYQLLVCFVPLPLSTLSCYAQWM